MGGIMTSDTRQTAVTAKIKKSAGGGSRIFFSVNRLGPHLAVTDPTFQKSMWCDPNTFGLLLHRPFCFLKNLGNDAFLLYNFCGLVYTKLK